jgi:hypothetical protein
VLRSFLVMKKGVLTLLVGAAASAALAPAARAGTFWSRERADGVVEFTNKQPSGGHWKVLFKTGPGKAAALRGSTDIVPPRDTSATRYSRFDRDILDGQAFYGIPEAFIRAVIKTESDFDPRVTSSTRARTSWGGPATSRSWRGGSARRPRRATPASRSPSARPTRR